MIETSISRCPKVMSTIGSGILIAVAFSVSPCLPEVLGDEPTPESLADKGWVKQAEILVTQLSELEAAIKNRPTGDLTFILPQEVKAADQVIWKLWLITGMPPYLSGDAESPSRIQRNSLAYGRYVAEHKHLTFEKIQRLGLENTISAYGSSLWYMTLRYLRERACVLSDMTIDIHSSPTSEIVEYELPKEVYARLSADLTIWLRSNEKELEWDSVFGRFRPRNVTYIETDVLYASLTKMLFRRR